MTRSYALVLAAAIGAMLGTLVRPSLIEIAIVAVVFAVVWSKLVQFSRRQARLRAA